LHFRTEKKLKLLKKIRAQQYANLHTVIITNIFAMLQYLYVKVTYNPAKLPMKILQSRLN